jgi:hypothetical protein
MSSASALSVSEFASLTEVGSFFLHKAIPAADATRLLDMRLIYNLLGSHRITKAGRARLAIGA